MVGEVGKLLSVPSARIELAHRGDTRGILSLDVSEDADLVHGNELLAGLVAEYPKGELRRIDTYRIDRVVAALERVDPSPVTGRPAAEDFAGCLVQHGTVRFPGRRVSDDRRFQCEVLARWDKKVHSSR